MTDLEKITATFEIEPVALTILQHQADWQGLSLEQLIASYVARCAKVIENEYGNALVADAFDGLAERNKPKQQRPEPKPEPESEPVYKRLQRLARQASEQGYSFRTMSGQIDLWTRSAPMSDEFGKLHTFPFNDAGIQAAFVWLEQTKARPESAR